MAWLCGVIALQGVVGAVQFEAHLPAELVWVHVALAALAWVLVLWAVAAGGPPRAARTFGASAAQIRGLTAWPRNSRTSDRRASFPANIAQMEGAS